MSLWRTGGCAFETWMMRVMLIPLSSWKVGGEVEGVVGTDDVGVKEEAALKVVVEGVGLCGVQLRGMNTSIPTRDTSA